VSPPRTPRPTAFFLLINIKDDPGLVAARALRVIDDRDVRVFFETEQLLGEGNWKWVYQTGGEALAFLSSPYFYYRSF
jgi:hypothetical protein